MLGTGLVSGWGVYSYHGVYSDNLTKVEVPIVDDELCKNAYAPLEYEYFDHFLCAGFLGVGAFKDSCKGYVFNLKGLNANERANVPLNTAFALVEIPEGL